MDPLYDDPQMAELIEKYGEIDLKPAEDPFRRFTVSIINQQLSGASASAIRDRLFESVEVTPEGLLAADEEVLRDAGLSRQKIEYVRNVADAFQEGLIRPDRFEGVPDEEAIDRLTEVRGVGTWTAKMYLLFVLAREDVFPVEDLGVRRGMEIAYGIEDRAAMIEKAEDWRPHRSYASRYLWRVSD